MPQVIGFLNAILRDEKIAHLMLFRATSLAFGGKEDDIRSFLRTLKVD